MIRILFAYVVPLVLPALGYLAYRLWDDWRTRRAGGRPVRSAWEDWPWPWIAGAGLACLLATMVWLSVVNVAPPGSEYEPARLKDGEVVPGRSVPQPGD
ncbi:MAG: DUF6111 family protein [Rhodospirillales bacterium]